LLGENLRRDIELTFWKYVASKSVVVHYDRTPILRESDKQYIIINFPKWTLAKVLGVDFTGNAN